MQAVRLLTDTPPKPDIFGSSSTSAVVDMPEYRGPVELGPLQDPEEGTSTAGVVISVGDFFTKAAQNTATGVAEAWTLQSQVPTDEETEADKRAKAAMSLINEWLAEKSGYDKEVWPKLKEALERDRLSARKLFDD